jgi:type II secretory pathway pseudopilin PulG
MSRRAGFTLIEICLALLIGMCLMALAVPSISGMLREQRLRRSFEAFDRFVRTAQLKSITEQRAYVMVWTDDGIELVPVERIETDAAEPERFAFAQDQVFTIERSAALTKKPVAEWIFWKSGTCEPAIISFSGPAGKWVVSYNPLTARGVFVESESA